MKKLTAVCIVFGVVHAVAMTFFATGPELAPLVVYFIDLPVAALTNGAASRFVELGIPIIACSILYPLVLFSAGWLGIRIFCRRTVA